MIPITQVALIVGWAGAVAPMPAPRPADKPIAIVHGTVLTVGPQGTIGDGTVIIKAGKIVAVGKSLAVPAGATVIDATGQFVMPGIIDCHSHTAIESGTNEGSDAVTAEVRIADVLDHNEIAMPVLADQVNLVSSAQLGLTFDDSQPLGAQRVLHRIEEVFDIMLG